MKKKLFLCIVLLGLLTGCTEEQQRVDFIREKLKTNEIWWSEGQNSIYYVVRTTDGAVWIVSRSSEKKLEEIVFRQIFSPNK